MGSGGDALVSNEAEPFRFPDHLVCIFLPFLSLRFSMTPILEM